MLPNSTTPSPQVTNYRDLLVWQKAIKLCEGTYVLARRLPRSEQHALAVQIRRSCVSVASNIAEGHSRSHTGEYLQFLAVARASLSELETQLTIAARVGYVADAECEPLMAGCAELHRMLHGLTRSLRQRRELSRDTRKGNGPSS